MTRWDIARRWLLPALRTETEADVIEGLKSGACQLWMGERSAMVTQYLGDCLHGWLAGGELEEIKRMIPGAEAWARAAGCTRVTIAGRKGWARALKPLGFEPQGAELVKVL